MPSREFQVVCMAILAFAIPTLAIAAEPRGGTHSGSNRKKLPVVAFPAIGDWTPLTRAGVPVGDIVGDGQLERDLVGDASAPVVYLAWDSRHLFLRIRLDATPIQSGSNLRPFAWGMEIDTDGNLSDYEFLLTVDGIANPDVVTLQENTVQGSVGDPNDNSEVTLVTYSTSAARVVAAASTFNGTADFFLDWSYPLADLVGAGIAREATVALLAGSSNNSRSLANDLASLSGATTTSDLFSDRVVLIPPCSAPDGENLTLQDTSVLTRESYEVCDTLTVGPGVGVYGPDGELILRTWSQVVIDELVVGIDARLAVENE